MKAAGWCLLAWAWVGAAHGQGLDQELDQAPAAEFAPEPEFETLTAAELQLDPEMAALLRADAYLKSGDRVEALRELRAILKRNVHHAGALSLVAATLADMGRHREAIQLCEKLAAEHGQDFVVLNNLAWLQVTAPDAALRNPERALELARQAVLLAPDNFSVWSTLAEAYYGNGYYAKAYRVAQQTLLLAQVQKADGSRLATYAEQLAKCRAAVETLSLLDP